MFVYLFTCLFFKARTTRHIWSKRRFSRNKEWIWSELDLNWSVFLICLIKQARCWLLLLHRQVYLLFKRIDQKFGSSCTLSVNKAIDNASWIMNLGSKALKLVELKAQSRELCLGQEPEMFAQSGNNEETNTVVEKRNLQEVRLNDHTFCFTKNIVRIGVDWKWN